MVTLLHMKEHAIGILQSLGSIFYKLFRPRSVIHALGLLLSVTCLLVIIQQAVEYKRLLTYAQLEREDAIYIVQECRRLSPRMQKLPGTATDCSHMRYVMSSSGYERAFFQLIATWPTPHSLWIALQGNLLLLAPILPMFGYIVHLWYGHGTKQWPW